jgi:hypothetical protein
LLPLVRRYQETCKKHVTNRKALDILARVGHHLLETEEEEGRREVGIVIWIFLS